MMITRVSGVAYHTIKPYQMTPEILIKRWIFADYYKQEKDIKSYGCVEYVAYYKEYNDEALDNDEYDTKNDEIDLIE